MPLRFDSSAQLWFYQAGVFEKGSACRCQFDAASAACQESRTYLVLKVSNLTT